MTLTAALKSIERLDFKAVDYEPAFDLGVRKYSRHSDGRDFQIGISGDGFEAMRNLNRNDLIAIRDWIDETLAASAPAA